MKPKLLFVLLLSVATFLSVIAPTQAATPPWEEASQVYGATMKLYSLNKWEDAQAALEGFIDYFPSNQNIPVAYLQLAHCQAAQGNSEGVAKTLLTLLKKFPDSYAAQNAWGTLYNDKYSKAIAAISKARSASDKEKEAADKKATIAFNDFIKFFSSMQSKTGGLFTGVGTRLDWRRVGDYYYYFTTGRTTWYPHSRTTGYRLNLYPLRGWSYYTPSQGMATQLLKLAVDEKKADALIKAISPSIKKLKIELPSSWKLLHIKLLEKKANGKKAAAAQRDKYLKAYKPNDPFSISLKSILLKDAWDNGKMDEVKKYSEELINNFPGFHDIYYPYTRWLDYLYSTGDNKEFIRLSKIYMQKNPMGNWRNTIIDRWVSLAERGAIKPTEALAMLDTEIAKYPRNNATVKNYLFKKIDVLLAAKNKKAATATLAKILSKPYWSKKSFDGAVKLANYDSIFLPLIKKARNGFTTPEVNSSSKVRELYDDLQYRISQEKVRHMEELASKMYNQYRRDAYTIKGMRDLIYYFFRKSLHANRNKWAAMMVSAYPFNPQTQEVVQWQIKAAKATKDFPLLAKYTDIAMKNFPGCNSYDSWLQDRLSCYDGTKQLPQRIAHARTLLKGRADSGELGAIGLLGHYECSALNTPAKQCAYWLSKVGQYKGGFAGIYCNYLAFDYGYTKPCGKWAWRSVDFKGSSRAAKALYNQKFRDDWSWKYKYDIVNVLSQGGLGVEACKAVAPLLSGTGSNFNARFDQANFGYACGAKKLQGKAMGAVSRIKNLAKTPYGRLSGLIMEANMMRLGGNGPVAAKKYMAAAKFYRRPVQRWQLMMMAGYSVPGPLRAQIFNKYAKQLRTTQDRIPWLLGQIYSIYKTKQPKKAKKALAWLRKSYKTSSTYGSIMDSIKAKKIQARKNGKKKRRR